MRKIITITIIILGLGTSYYISRKMDTNSQTNPTVQATPAQPSQIEPSPTPSAQPKSAVKQYTMAEVARHVSDEENYVCWTVIHDKVYDITEYVNHPGGGQISQICGTDGTALFENRPNIGTPHPQSVRDILKQYYIGDLKK